MTFVNLLKNPSGRRGLFGYSALNGTLGQDAGLDTYTVAAGALAASNVGILIQPLVIGTDLLASTTYTISSDVYAHGAGNNTAIFLTGAITAQSPSVAGEAWGRVSLTFTTPASGSINLWVLNSSSIPAAGVVAFRDAKLELGSVATAYLDGTASNYMWSGAPDASKTWGPVVTVVANPTFWPPRNEVTVTLPPGDVMSAASLTRIVAGVATATRSQPAPGLDTRLVYDYESERDQAVSYQFITTFQDPTGITTAWDEVWASLAAWTGSTSGWSVSGGKAVSNDGTNNFYSITRGISTPGKYRLTIGSLTQSGFLQTGAKSSGVFLMNGSTVVLQIAPSGNSSTLQVMANGATYSTAISGASPFTVDMLAGSIVITGTGGTFSVGVNGTITAVQLTARGPGTTTVGRVTVGAYPTSYTSTTTSSPVTLSPSQAWLIHPSNPALSMPVSSHDRSAATIRTLGDVTNASQATEHQILGEKFPITTTSGPRMGNKLQAVVGVRTRAQEAALMGILADSTPILFRAPASYPIGLEEGFYSVGDVARARLSQRLGDPMRNFTLPLTQVQPPVVAVQNVGWSWAALAAEFPTWSAVAQAFNTWADVLANNRKPGY